MPVKDISFHSEDFCIASKQVSKKISFCIFSGSSGIWGNALSVCKSIPLLYGLIDGIVLLRYISLFDVRVNVICD